MTTFQLLNSCQKFSKKMQKNRFTSDPPRMTYTGNSPLFNLTTVPLIVYLLYLSCLAQERAECEEFSF